MNEIFHIKADNEIEIIKGDSKIVILEKQSFPDGYEYSYFFSMFALQLNLPEYVYSGLPSTDSRYRKDIRALENGDIKQATDEYKKIIGKHKDIAAGHKEKWFNHVNGQWEFNDMYWKSRNN